MEGCREACHELGIELDNGIYRVDSLKQDMETKGFWWQKVYKFSLEMR